MVSPRSVALVTRTQSAAPEGRRGDPGLLAVRTTVPAVLHPVGPLPTAVYWRRRLLVLTLLLSVLGGGGWLGMTYLGRRPAQSSLASAAATSPRTVVPTPSLEQVVPSLAGVAIPTAVPAASPAAVTAAPTTAAPAAGGPCSDAMLSLQLHAPASAAVGTRPTFELVVTNTSAVPCVRAVDSALQQMVLLDAAGNRVWGSSDCAAAGTSDTRTLAPGEALSFPVTWRGLTSEPTCTAPRVTPPPGAYVLRGRLDTLTTPDVPLTLV
jgi:hypothetical protein